MIVYLIRRILLAIPVTLGIVFIVLLIIRITPGDPAIILLGQAAPPESVAALRKQLGLNHSILGQYVIYLGDVLQGDLGRSYRTNQKVAVIISQALPNTIQLTIAGLLVSLVIGLPAGVISAIRRNTGWDYSLTTLSLLGLSMPVFWTGIMMIWLFSYYLRWLPTGGTGSWRHLVMPALAVGSYTAANFMRMVRASILDVLQADFVRTAHAKGVGPWSVVMRHVFRNAVIPLVTTIGLQVGLLLGGSILTETVFAWPGVGLEMVRAIETRDIVVVQGLILVMALIFVGVNLLVDLSYVFLDPRIKYE